MKKKKILKIRNSRSKVLLLIKTFKVKMYLMNNQAILKVVSFLVMMICMVTMKMLAIHKASNLNYIAWLSKLIQGNNSYLVSQYASHPISKRNTREAIYNKRNSSQLISHSQEKLQLKMNLCQRTIISKNLC